MSKAFDLIDFTFLLRKLSHYGIHDTALKFLKRYLTDRKQYCYYKGTSTSTLTTSRGVPQGSIHGPLLYINDFQNVTNKFQFSCMLMIRHYTVHTIRFMIQTTLT